MDFQLLLDGFLTTISPFNFLLVMLGMMAGIIFGALPGISASMTIVLLLPFTYYLGIVPSIILLVAVYMGSAYGGAITAILFNTPGDPAAVITAMDGYPMAKQGKAGRALGLSISGGAVGGIFSIIVMLFLSPPLSAFALKIQSAEYFALAVLGMTLIASIGRKNPLRTLISGCFGILLATIGLDPMTGTDRLTFGSLHLMNGIDFIPVMIGAFAFAEVLSQVVERQAGGTFNMSSKIPLEGLKLKDVWYHRWCVLRASVIGTIIGILPGTGGSIASIVSYGAEMKASKKPEQFGKGAEEGVLAPETANNAAAGGSMIPMLTLGIPGSPTTAVILAALTLQGLQPGPQMMTEQPLLLYVIFFSMLIASIAAFIGGRLGVQIFALMTRLPYSILGPTILAFSIVGAFAVDNSMFQVWIALLFGVIGYFMSKYDFAPSAMILGLVLGKMMEETFRRHLLVTNGDYSTFITQPISGFVLLIAALGATYPLLSKAIKKKKQTA
ncbi:tripartite tricarboxylate transporter permease [Brevibacillus composti]|uniref:Tripartite tricarboxylate transporter permease n=1 Tax=Brevibacillus composti TaxID=2796470 RepID=A0A7T5EI40_9BACL|nr:tripartite tricarboxylate transporter permease [Brevibacillus composti]QQE73041.1 tripartite tricarboxylate transporter permease [Brevibacillus composti]QUO40119.1 tripartite tricarboxylate transporter permease [Brevibacillus composti]